MTYEYYLEAADENHTFPVELVEAMHVYLKNLPSYLWEDGSYTIFKTEADRDRRVSGLIEDSKNKKNNYLDPEIHIDPYKVMLSIVVNPDVDRYLYEFVLWCQERWPCELYYGAELVSPEELLAEL